MTNLEFKRSIPFRTSAQDAHTLQDRRFDIAFGREFAIVNVHAESRMRNADGEVLRCKQFKVILCELRRGMAKYGLLAGLLCGDLNTQTDTAADDILRKYFFDTNESGGQGAVRTLTSRAAKVQTNKPGGLKAKGGT